MRNKNKLIWYPLVHTLKYIRFHITDRTIVTIFLNNKNCLCLQFSIITVYKQCDLASIFTGDGEFPAQMASNAEIVSIWWRHHVPKRHYTCWNTIITFRCLTYVLVMGLWQFPRKYISGNENCCIFISFSLEFIPQPVNCDWRVLQPLWVIDSTPFPSCQTCHTW